MSDLVVRRIRFDLAGEDIPFVWQPERPAFAVLCNFISLLAPGFEKFVVDATREAIPLMTDPDAVEEANLYLRQEAQHSSAHVRHINALAKRWPGLEQTMHDVIASYDRLTETKPLKWRLAYTAVLENTFTPYFKVFLDHEDVLFAPGDERVGSLFLWHFVEEIEHRSSALNVYNAVHPSFRYRLKAIPSVVAHLGEALEIITTGFQRYVPPSDGGEFGRLLPAGFTPRAIMDAAVASRRLQRPEQKTYAGIPSREVRAMLAGLIRSQGPNHDPDRESLPAFAARWFRRFDEDPRSAARWYSYGAPTASSAP